MSSFAEAIAACPTPAYHETHRYCPSCPWTEALDQTPEQKLAIAQAAEGKAHDAWRDAVQATKDAAAVVRAKGATDGR